MHVVFVSSLISREQILYIHEGNNWFREFVESCSIVLADMKIKFFELILFCIDFLSPCVINVFILTSSGELRECWRSSSDQLTSMNKA